MKNLLFSTKSILAFAFASLVVTSVPMAQAANCNTKAFLQGLQSPKGVAIVLAGIAAIQFCSKDKNSTEKISREEIISFLTDSEKLMAGIKELLSNPVESCKTILTAIDDQVIGAEGRGFGGFLHSYWKFLQGPATFLVAFIAIDNFIFNEGTILDTAKSCKCDGFGIAYNAVAK